MTQMITCDKHGTLPEAAICSHMFKAWQAGEPVSMISAEPIDEDPFPDAWCDDCEKIFQAQREKLVDGFKSKDGLVLLCSRCYELVRDTAQAAGHLRIV